MQESNELKILIRKIEKLKLIQEITACFNETLELNHLLDLILEKIADALDAEAGSIWLYNPVSAFLHCYSAKGPTKDKVIGARVYMGQGVIGWVAKNMKSQMVEDVLKDKHFTNHLDKHTGFVTRTMISSPLHLQGKPIGAIQIINKNKETELFAQDDLYLLEAIANNASIAIRNAQVLADQIKIKERTKVIQEVSLAFSENLDLNNLLDDIIEKIANALNAVAGSVWIFENNTKELICKVAKGPTKDKVIGAKVKIGKGVVGWVAQNQKSKIVSDVLKDEAFSSDVDKKTGFITRSMICAPLVHKGALLGAIQIINKENPKELFYNDDLNLLEAISGNAAISIKNAQLYQTETKLEELSSILKISQEITSTLNLEKVLYTIVNLSSTFINHKRCIIALTDNDQIELKAISGEEEIDNEDETLEPLKNIFILTTLKKEDIFIPDKLEYLKTEAPYQEIKDYFEINTNILSCWLKVLKDEEGNLGIIYMESDNPNFISKSQLEFLEILSNQTSVAIRNAQLYNQVPLAGMIENFHKKKKAWASTPKTKIFGYIAICICIILFLSLFKIKISVDGPCEVFVHSSPKNSQKIYSQVSGFIKTIPEYIKENAYVSTNNILLKIDRKDMELERIKLASAISKIKKELNGLKANNKMGEYQLKQIDYKTKTVELKHIMKKLKFTDIYSPINGIIMSSEIEELYGKLVNPGELLLEVANLKLIRVDINLLEDDLGEIKPKDKIYLKVRAYPADVFEGIVETISAVGEKDEKSKSEDVFFTVRAIIRNKDLKLKPGMTGRAKIYSDKKPIGYVWFRGIYKYFSLLIWRYI